MIECLACGRKHRPGTLFCYGCGVYLPTGDRLRTGLLPNGELPFSLANPSIDEPVQEPAQVPPPPLRVKVIPTGRLVQVPPASEVHVGRRDASRGIFPDLDLGPDGGRESGVSRRHCKIRRHGSAYLVVDLASANGTFVNGHRLVPYVSRTIRDGDELQLGCIKLTVIMQGGRDQARTENSGCFASG